MTETKLVFLLLLLYYSYTKQMNPEKEQFCEEVKRCQINDKQVCGIRQERERYRLKVFKDECELMQYGCKVEEKEAYGLINMEFCDYAHPINENATVNYCIQECPRQVNNDSVCGLRPHGDGFTAHLFTNECEMLKYNCEKNLTFHITDHFVCDGLDLPEHSRRPMIDVQNTTEYPLEVTGINDAEDMTETTNSDMKTTASGIQTATETNIRDRATLTPKRKPKNLVVVDGSIFENTGNINDTVDNFFAGTHVFDLPLKDVSRSLTASTRRKLVRVFGPVMVFKPWITIPKNISKDVMHQPTLASCFHKCPTECPDTYAPICGTPGMVAREPSLMFKNHCLMDAAQCKMRWDNASFTAPYAAYAEASFMFCLSDTLNGLYRFLPLIRTLQHMGRLKKRGRYHNELRNMRFFNELLSKTPKIMG